MSFKLKLLPTIGLAMILGSTASAASRCEFLLAGPVDVAGLSIATSEKPSTQPPVNQRSTEDLSFLDTKTAWNLSVQGIRKLSSGLHRMENALYYFGSGVLAKEHTLADGPGGSGKTFSATLLLRSQVAAMVDSIQKLTPQDITSYGTSIEIFIQELLQVAAEDRTKSPDQRLFTLQLHEAINEIPLLGGVNPFVFAKTGKKETDYSKALIAAKNFFALLDEIDKAPVAIQMTLLSILNEREALDGNRVIKTALESVVATTNASLGELISQAKSYEIGGRQALIDRLIFKIHMVNVPASAADRNSFRTKAKNAPGLAASTLIDLRSLRPLARQVRIPKDILQAATEISQYMDLKYTDAYNRAIQESPKGHPRFYPSFSGSGRTLAKLVPAWQSAFIMRQLIKGVPFENLDLQMTAKDLVDLAPILLQGGPETFEPGKVSELRFNIYNGISALSNDPNRTDKNDRSSLGHYDPFTQIFSFKDPVSFQHQKFYFDISSKTLIGLDEYSTETMIKLNPAVDQNGRPTFSSLTDQLFELHTRLAKESDTVGFFYQFGTYINDLLQGAPLRDTSRSQLEEIQAFHTDFIARVNDSIDSLRRQRPSNYKSLPEHLKTDEQFKKDAHQIAKDLDEAIQGGNHNKLLEVSIRAVQQFYHETTSKFHAMESPVKGLLATLLFGGNAQMYGPPGSAKTLIGRSVFKAALAALEQRDKVKLATTLATMISKGDEAQKRPPRKIYIKQFHPQSTESDIVGHLDLKSLNDGGSFIYNRETSLSAEDVVFALLDEWEKSPPGVRTAALSVLNERAVMLGDETVELAIEALFLATNSTPSEFLIGQGRFSVGFPIHDRIHRKIYFFNKFGPNETLKLFERSYFGMPLSLETPLPIRNLKGLIAKVVIPEEFSIGLLAEIEHQFMVEAVKKSEADRKYHADHPDIYPDYYINSRGESLRTDLSGLTKELPAEIVLDRILRNDRVDELVSAREIEIEVRDLVSLANIYLTSNFAYQVGFSYPTNGFITFEVIEKDVSALDGRITLREQALLTRLREEAQSFVSILNTHVQNYLKKSQDLIAKHPQLFPTVFSSDTARKAWLKSQGYGSKP